MWSSFVGLFAQALGFLHGLTGSWGWAIVALTVILRLLLWPLTYSQVVSSKRLQELQPEMQRLRERYKDQPAKLNEAMVKLWREHRVNPMSGCLPLLVQLPFLWGIYQVLITSAELKGAPFLWVPNLGAPDPYVLPVLAAVTTFVQSWMLTPRGEGAQGPNQQVFLWMMPIMILVLTRSLPAGVGVYWVVSNLFSIGQQWVVPRVGVTRRNQRA